ncbi:MAG TPA: alpha/beta hydrolase [Alphaproteobacteria bacterium]|nr:alpha/beta hydrolase [Alphaproteobacteria bacterium]
MNDPDPPPDWLARPNAPRLAYRRSAGRAPGTVFLGGFASDMTGTKATALEAAARAAGRAFLRFDYRGHGRSEGRIEEATIGDWLSDALAAFDQLTQGPQILVGSSMGGWIALLLALARPDKVRALVGVAAAPDFTERLVRRELSEADRETLAREGVVYRPSQYGPPTPFTSALLEEGRKHLLLDHRISIGVPVRLLHGQRDPDVPWQLSLTLAEKLETSDVRIELVKDGDHRLSRPQDIQLLVRTVEELAD